MPGKEKKGCKQQGTLYLVVRYLYSSFFCYSHVAGMPHGVKIQITSEHSFNWKN